MYDTTFEGLMMLCVSSPFRQKGVYTMHMSRENWLLDAVDIFRPWFEEHGAIIPEKVRVSVGFSKGQRKATIGVCYHWCLLRLSCRYRWRAPAFHVTGHG
jgi:hypothetical protein